MWYLYCSIYILVDKNGDVCISILHDPGEDKWGYERPEERWLPVHTVETIIMSVISMLADPNDESPANVDAGVSWSNDNNIIYYLLQKEWRNDYEGTFKKKVMKCVRKSQDML